MPVSISSVTTDAIYINPIDEKALQKDIKDLILYDIATYEAEYGVSIPFVAEVGSRVWGTADESSDYDVKFIYVSPIDDYISIFEHRDVIERSNGNVISYVGWDLKKALQLLYKGSPQLKEWLASPIIYKDERGLRESMDAAYSVCINEVSLFYHYFSVAKGHWKRYLADENGNISFKGDVTYKRYIQTLRHLLAALYVYENREFPLYGYAELIEWAFSTHAIGARTSKNSRLLLNAKRLGKKNIEDKDKEWIEELFISVTTILTYCESNRETLEEEYKPENVIVKKDTLDPLFRWFVCQEDTIGREYKDV